MLTTQPAGQAVQHSAEDLDEALHRDGGSGATRAIAGPLEEATYLRGILVALDPDALVPGNPFFPPADDPEEFLRGITPMLDRHPLARDAEVRAVGRSLHLVIRFDPEVVLDSEAERLYWTNIVWAVQFTLPIDALAWQRDDRAQRYDDTANLLGTIDDDDDGAGHQLREGVPVDPDRVVEHVRELSQYPLSGWATMLFGADWVKPCPRCRKPESRMTVSATEAECNKCGRRRLRDIVRLVLRDPEVAPTADRETGAVRRHPASN